MTRRIVDLSVAMSSPLPGFGPNCAGSGMTCNPATSCWSIPRRARATGYTVSALPVKLAGGSAGWCRAKAIFDE